MTNDEHTAATEAMISEAGAKLPAVMANAYRARAEKGLRLEWIVEDGVTHFSAFANDEAHKAKLIGAGVAKGWELL